MEVTFGVFDFIRDCAMPQRSHEAKTFVHFRISQYKWTFSFAAQLKVQGWPSLHLYSESVGEAVPRAAQYCCCLALCISFHISCVVILVSFLKSHQKQQTGINKLSFKKDDNVK